MKISVDFGPPFTKPKIYLIPCNATLARRIMLCSQHIVLVIRMEFPPKLYQVTSYLLCMVSLATRQCSCEIFLKFPSILENHPKSSLRPFLYRPRQMYSVHICIGAVLKMTLSYFFVCSAELAKLKWLWVVTGRQKYKVQLSRIFSVALRSTTPVPIQPIGHGVARTENGPLILVYKFFNRQTI